MICSMTAFGRTRTETSGISITVEVRTLNSRGLDVVVRLPKNYQEFEDTLRKQVAQAARRGRVEVFVSIESTRPESKVPRLDLTLARYYWEQLQELHRRLPGTDPPKLEHLLGIPHIFEAPLETEDREAILELLTGALGEVLQQIHGMRCREGEALLQDCLARITALREGLSRIESRKDTVLSEYQRRLRERTQELLQDVAVDENRLVQEVACFAERSDINEEIVRLRSHFDQFESLFSGSEPADGRRLDFLTQELLRETNTIGCKTSDLETAQVVVQMKSEIGKLKEQVQNIE